MAGISFRDVSLLWNYAIGPIHKHLTSSSGIVTTGYCKHSVCQTIQLSVRLLTVTFAIVNCSAESTFSSGIRCPNLFANSIPVLCDSTCSCHRIEYIYILEHEVNEHWCLAKTAKDRWDTCQCRT